MRDVVNISLPKEMTLAVEKMVKKEGFSTKSEFFRYIIREKLEEEDLYRRVQISEAEFKAGKGKLLKSLADLD